MAAAVDRIQETQPVRTTESEDTTKKGYIFSWILGAVSGMALGTIVGFILDSQYANYKDVVCGIPGHEDGGWHGEEENSWHHDGPTYETYASVADQMWFLGSMTGGLVAGILIAVTITLYQRHKAAQPPAVTPTPKPGNWWSSIFPNVPKADVNVPKADVTAARKANPSINGDAR